MVPRILGWKILWTQRCAFDSRLDSTVSLKYQSAPWTAVPVQDVNASSLPGTMSAIYYLPSRIQNASADTNNKTATHAKFYTNKEPRSIHNLHHFAHITL